MTFVVPTYEIQELIRQKCNEDPATKDASLQTLKDWLAKEPHLPDDWDDEGLRNFLRGCNYSLEKSKKKIDMHFTMEATIPEFFTNRDITRPEMQELVKHVHYFISPKLTLEGARVHTMRIQDKYIPASLDDLLKFLLMIKNYRLREEKFGVVGDVYVVDAQVVNSGYIVALTPNVLRKYLLSIMDINPFKIKEIHIVNAHTLVHTLYRIVKPFIKNKIKERVFFHTDGYQSLHNFVSKDFLPEEYGGTLGKIKNYHDELVKRLEEYIPWFKEQDKYVADESKRIIKTTNQEDLFGVEGSFKKLAVD